MKTDAPTAQADARARLEAMVYVSRLDGETDGQAVAAVARELGRHPRTIYRWLNGESEIPGVVRAQLGIVDDQ